MSAEGEAGLGARDFGAGLSVVSEGPGHGALPVLAFEPHIGKLLNVHRVVLVLGETASGKTTQLPQMFCRLGWTNHGFQIAVVQPNALTAVRLAERLQAEAGSYSFADSLTENDRDRQHPGPSPVVVFDQWTFLYKILVTNPLLDQFSLIFLDEIHDRRLYLDLVCGLLKRVLSINQDLRLVLASATMNMKSLVRYFGPVDPEGCATIVCEGRNNPIDLAYLERPCFDIVTAALEIIISLHKKEPATSGDILVFVPSKSECEELVRRASEEASEYLLCVPLHERLSLRDQQISINTRAPSKQRKVIVATDIAEASVSIPNIRFVVDSLFSTRPHFDMQSGLLVMETRAISRSRADQRAGRAGRVAPGGKCIRLCTEQDFHRFLPRHEEPEILHCDLIDAVLFLKSIGIDKVGDFPFIDVPPSVNLMRALEMLFALGAIDELAEISEVGRKLARLGLPVRLGKVVLKAQETDAARLLSPIVDLVSIIGSGVATNVLVAATVDTLKTFASREGDHLTLCNMARGALEGNKYWRTMSHERLDALRRFKLGLLRTLRSLGLINGNLQYHAKGEEDGNTLLRYVASGFFMNAAQLQSTGRYKTIREGREVQLHSSSVLARLGKPPPYIIFHEAVIMPNSPSSSLFRSSDDMDVTTVRLASAIDPRWLAEIAPHYYVRVKSTT